MERFWLLTNNQKAIVAALSYKQAIEGLGSIRFNELKRTLKELNFKLSTPALVRNLNKLAKKDIVKRTQRGKQNVSYFLTSYPILGDLGAISWLKDSEARVSAMTTDRLMGFMIGLAQLHGLHLLNLRLKNICGRISNTDYNLKAMFLDSFYNSIYAILVSHCEERKDQSKEELEETIADIDIIIKKIKGDLFEKRFHI